MKEARKAAGMTQEKVAEELGRPQSFVSKVETGERRIDPTELQTFAKLYGKPITYFLGG
ncbi:MAG TPA: helix-turn-helix transcriptional regulator [Thermoanaerobaculia bacterium]|nr:helix-turn-helix transcriptional regulator [Thermoanaerobaculia bacterium]